MLPTSRPFHQGQTGLCWIFATLNAIETNYLVRTQGKKLELSRSQMQYWNWEDRYTRKIKTGENYLYEGGTTVDALVLLRAKGMLALEDYSENPKHVPVWNPFSLTGTSMEELIANLEATLVKTFGKLPDTAHFEGKVLTPQEMQQEVLQDETWEAYAPSLNGTLGYAKHWDPDARRGTQALYIPKDRFYKVVGQSLERGQGLAISLCGHDIAIYGAEFDESGDALLYYVKDNYANPFYSVNPKNMTLGQRFCGLSTLKLPE